MGRFTGEAGRKESQLVQRPKFGSEEMEALLLELGGGKRSGEPESALRNNGKEPDLQSEIFAMIRELNLVQSLDGKISQQYLAGNDMGGSP